MSETAEYKPEAKVHLGVDSGVMTGAVLFQIIPTKSTGGQIQGSLKAGQPVINEVHVFADYLAEGITAGHNAMAIIDILNRYCNGRADYRWTDPAGKARNAVGPSVMAEFERCGLKMEAWPITSVRDSLARLECLLNPAKGPPRLIIHPRCKALIRAFESYRRAKKENVWLDWPVDPQHPQEDLIDALRGAIQATYPDDVNNLSNITRVSFGKVF